MSAPISTTRDIAIAVGAYWKIIIPSKLLLSTYHMRNLHKKIAVYPMKMHMLLLHMVLLWLHIIRFLASATISANGYFHLMHSVIQLCLSLSVTPSVQGCYHSKFWRISDTSLKYSVAMHSTMKEIVFRNIHTLLIFAYSMEFSKLSFTGMDKVWRLMFTSIMFKIPNISLKFCHGCWTVQGSRSLVKRAMIR